MNIAQKEREILRTLASKYMEIAALSVQREKKELWKALNRGKMQRPMVVLDQLPWNELNNEGDITCQAQNSFCRGLEWDLRSTIYKWEHFPVDMVVEPFITIPRSIINTGYGIKVDEELLRTDADNGVVSHHYANQIKTEEDICKIKMPEADISKELQEKICVLEVAEKAEIHHNTGDHQRFPDSRTFCPVDQIREIIIDRRRQHQ